ncbi:hypothetical protein BN9982_380012 [Mycobacterium tuberculosis]|nr:hypothetical protein BN9982_380012 [Mycobacterium tuberculosis]
MVLVRRHTRPRRLQRPGYTPAGIRLTRPVCRSPCPPVAWRVLFQLAPAGGRQRRDMAQELADWLAASEGIIPSGNGVVAGSASLIRGPADRSGVGPQRANGQCREAGGQQHPVSGRIRATARPRRS